MMILIIINKQYFVIEVTTVIIGCVDLYIFYAVILILVAIIYLYVYL